MADALSIALSGLMAQKTRLDATANNIANASTEGYSPLQTNLSTQGQGGVTATVTEATGDTVDLSREAVSLIETKLAFKGDIAAAKTADKMMGDLLDIIT